MKVRCFFPHEYTKNKALSDTVGRLWQFKILEYVTPLPYSLPKGAWELSCFCKDVVFCVTEEATPTFGHPS